jgi:hypothetical protein
MSWQIIVGHGVKVLLNPISRWPDFRWRYPETLRPDPEKIVTFTTQLFSLFNVLGKGGRLFLQVASLSQICAKKFGLW